MRTFLLAGALLAVVTVGCGPMLVPAVQRLKPEDQAELDQAWDNLLTPPDRVDRSLLLDVLLQGAFHVVGADRVFFRSEKNTSSGLVVMTVDFDRLRPGNGTFEFTLTSPDGQLVRHEHYTGDEVLDRLNSALDPGAVPEGVAAAREEQMRAATQPSR